MRDTPAHRPKRPRVSDTGAGENEASNNRKRPLEKHGMIQIQDGQHFVKPKRQRVNTQAENEPNYYA
jgi:hypothetical protein